MSAPSFRFGAVAFNAASGAEWARRARQIEDMGFATLLTGDHIGSELFAPLSALTAAAAATTTLHVGCTTFANDFRHPAVLAKEAATLDILTDGRFELGIGAGWAKRQYEMSGVAFDPPGARVARLAEAVHIIQKLWTGEAVVFDGRYYRLNGLKLQPKPSHPLQLFIGGTGKRVLSLAAQRGSIIGILESESTAGGAYDAGPETVETVAAKVGWVRDAAGGRAGEIELALLIRAVAVTEDVDGEAAAIAARRGITPEQVLASPYFLVGTVDAIVDQLETLRTHAGISYISVMPNGVDALAPVVARLAGR